MELELHYKQVANTIYDLKYKKVFLYADFNVINHIYEKDLKIPKPIELYPDSTAIFLTLLFFKRYIRKRLISTDIQQEILSKSLSYNKKLFFFGDDIEVLKCLYKTLKKENPKINICGIQNGYNYNSENVITKINECNTDILFIGLGTGRQEKWIIENYEKINAKLIIAVGGWFKILAGIKKRAPLFIRKLNLEWLYRLLTEFPYVWKRYFWGLPKFFLRVTFGKIKLILIE